MATITKTELIRKLEAQRNFVGENSTNSGSKVRTYCGEFKSYDAKNDRIILFDHDKKDYRSMTMKTLRWIQVGGEKYTADDIVASTDVEIKWLAYNSEPRVNGYLMDSLEAHKAIFGPKLEGFNGDGLTTTLRTSSFKVNGKSFNVNFEGLHNPYRAKSQAECVEFTKARIEAVKAAYVEALKPKSYKFTIDGVEIDTSRYAGVYSRRLDVTEKGDKLAAKLLGDLTPAEGSYRCAIATTSSQVFGFTRNGREYKVSLNDPMVEPGDGKDFDVIVQERYEKCKALVESSYIYEFEIEGVKFKMDERKDLFDQAKLLSQEVGSKLGDLVSAWLVMPDQRFNDGNVKYVTPELDAPFATPQDVERYIRTNVAAIKELQDKASRIIPAAILA